jgi:2-C-methyl-D-erythritol 4-phosphate cytidylyltransferase
MSVLSKAYEQPYKSVFTDDASVVEAAGFTVQLVEGNRENIKITNPEDILVAESLLGQR